MPKAKSKATRQTGRPSSSGPAVAIDAPRPAGVLWAGALLAVLVALVASGMLAYSHIAAVSLPGCGPGSPCAQAAASRWGSIPGLGWPTAFIAAAYFAAALIGWVFSRRSVPRMAMGVLGLGALGSVLFLVVSVVEGLFCGYCITANVANLIFVALAVLVYRRPDRAAVQTSGVPAGLATFMLVSLMLSLAQSRANAVAAEQAERKRSEDEARMLAGQTKPADPPTPPINTPDGTVIENPQPAPSGEIWHTGFSGRYRRGPEQSPVRIVMFTDYQCPDCQRIEREATDLMRRFPQIAVSIRYFPFCTDCNPAVGKNLHPNACWAARAAEAAGMISGTDGFWRMHKWLFDGGNNRPQGSFTAAQLNAGLRELGFEATQFKRTMESPATLERVKADIADANALGLMQTPMIFINGVEMRGWNAPQALQRTVESLIAKNLPAASSDGDRPPLAVAKLIADWREGAVKATPDPARPAFGASTADARATVIVYGDYLEPTTAELDIALRALLPERPGVRYEFRYFPVDQSCNPSTPRTQYPGACLAARAAEAANVLHGADGFRFMHEWLMNNRSNLNQQTLMAAAPSLGFSQSDLSSTLDVDAVSARIKGDGAEAIRQGLTSVPTFYLNGRPVPRWKAGDKSILPRLLDEAAKPPQ